MLDGIENSSRIPENVSRLHDGTSVHTVRWGKLQE
jgi:hypothetical protein